MATCVNCNCVPCSCSSCNNCGCDTCDGDCATPKYAPIKECVPEMIKPSFALGLDCDRRKRKILNKVKALLTSDGKNVKFRDGSEDDRIALNLIELAYAHGIIVRDGSGQLGSLKPSADGIDVWLGRVGNTLGFHAAPNNGNSFDSSTIENRNCGSLALIICNSDGNSKLAKWEACDVPSGEVYPIGINSDGYPVCIEPAAAEEEEAAPAAEDTGFLVSKYLPTPELVVDKWPGVAYPFKDGTSGTDSGSFNIPASLPDPDKIKRLIVYVESGTYHQKSGAYRDLWVDVNSERVHYDNGSVDQIGVSAAAGTGGNGSEASAIHNGGQAATWSLGTNVLSDYFWKLKIYVKGAMYDYSYIS